MTRSILRPRGPNLSLHAKPSPRLRPLPPRCYALPDGAQRRLRDALRLLHRGGMDVALTAGAVGGLGSLLVPGGPSGAALAFGAACATSAAAVVAQGWHGVFTPELYCSYPQQLTCADRAWERGYQDLALRHVTSAASMRDPNALLANYYIAQQRLGPMAQHAVANRLWPALRLLAGVLPTGSLAYWDAILAVHEAGIAHEMPLTHWVHRLLRDDSTAIGGNEAALLTDILVAGPRVPMQFTISSHALDRGVLACVRAAQDEVIDAPTRRRLARLFVELPQLDMQAMHALAHGPEATRQALFVLDDMGRAGDLPPDQRDAVFELLNAVALDADVAEPFLVKVRDFARGATSFNALCLTAAHWHAHTVAAQAALAQHMLAVFVAGDTPEALASARRFSEGYDPGNVRHKALEAAFSKAPGAFRQLFLAAIRAADRAAVGAMLPHAARSAPAERLEFFDAMCAAKLFVERRMELFQGDDLLLRDLSLPRLQALLPTLAGRPGLGRAEDLALRDLVNACDGQLPQDALRVWQMAARTPELVGVFKRLASKPRVIGILHERLFPALQDGALTEPGFLLALHLLDTVPAIVLDAAPAILLDHPRCTALLRNQALLKHTQRARRLLSALAQLGRPSQLFVTDRVEKVLTWPNDAQLRSWMHETGESARVGQAAALRDLQAHGGNSPKDRQSARAALQSMQQSAEILCLHAEHVHAQGDQAATQVCREGLRVHGRSLRAHLTALAALLPADGEGHALVKALLEAPDGPAEEKACKALNFWRKGCSKAPDAELAAQIHAVASLRVHNEITLRQMRKPPSARSARRRGISSGRDLRHARTSPDSPPPPAPDFFAAKAHLKPVQHLYNQQLVPLQVEALHALIVIDSFGGNGLHDTPMALLAEKRRMLQVTYDTQPVFDALLARFRDQQLFWSFANRMRRHDSHYRAGFDTTLRHLLAGTHTEQRRGSPQMQALFGSDSGDGPRAALRAAWEAGAWSEVPAGRPHAGLRLHDTGAFEDFASSGDEITGSCHSVVHGAYSHYLLGRVVCGSKRMLTIKDATGRMLARAVFRLMLDEHDQPALLVSRTYAVGGESAHASKTLLDFARARAQALGLPLVQGTQAQGAPGMRVRCKTGEFAEYWDERSGDDWVAALVWSPKTGRAAA